MWVVFIAMSVRMSAASTLVAATYWRTSAVDELSISQAVYMHEQAELLDLHPRVGDPHLDRLLVGQQRPWVWRDSARSHIMSNIFFALAMERMAWWMRPPPSRRCATSNALPSPPSRLSAGTRTFS